MPESIAEWIKERLYLIGGSLRRPWRWLVKLISGLPLIGPLAYCTWSDHKASLREFSVTMVFSTVTFWLTALFLKAFNAFSGSPYYIVLQSTVNTGQLFIFSVAFMGPILLTAAEDPKNARQFPGRLWHFLALVTLAIVAAGCYALQQSSKINGADNLLNKDFLFNFSVAVAVCAMLLRYLATVYRKQTFDPEREMKKPEEDFSDAFARHREGEA